MLTQDEMLDKIAKIQFQQREELNALSRMRYARKQMIDYFDDELKAAEIRLWDIKRRQDKLQEAMWAAMRKQSKKSIPDHIKKRSH
jgi:hypothetical protein